MLKTIASFLKNKYVLAVMIIVACIHPAGICADWEPPETPTDLKTPRIIVGDDLLLKTLKYKLVRRLPN